MEQITRILIEDILTFAYCDEDQMAEDFSVAQLERIASALRASDQAVTQAFLVVVQQMAKESRGSGDTERAEQLDSMPSHLGLA
jgi:hypothetical protein